MRYPGGIRVPVPGKNCDATPLSSLAKGRKKSALFDFSPRSFFDAVDTLAKTLKTRVLAVNIVS
jgi:hypothetical protein